jgi:hypothetical protein
MCYEHPTSKFRITKSALLAIAIMLSVPQLANAESYNFTTIDVPDSLGTSVNGNSTTTIVGGYSDQDEMGHGFLLKKGVYTTIDVDNVPNVIATDLNGVNANGEMTGTYILSTGTWAFFRSKDGVITTLEPPGSIRSQGGFINAQGQAVGAYRSADQKRHGFIWKNGFFTTINVPNDYPTWGSTLLGINDHGQVVGSYVDENGDANNSNVNRHGFLLSNGSYTTLDVPNSLFTVAEGINNAGQIGGLYFDIDSNRHGFVLTKSTYTTVDVPDAIATSVYSINSKGEISGSYTDKYGKDHGFIGTPVR